MTLAFFYLVIGDLIIIHQKLIFKYDVYAGQPLLKPDKSSKKKYIDLRGKSINQIQKLITFVSDYNIFNIGDVNLCYVDFLPVIKPPQGLMDVKTSSFSLRGPPSFIC